MLSQVLTSIGLSEKETKIYLTLLEIGSQPVSTIAKKTKINRTTCYLIIDELTNKGLVSSFNKASVKYITAEPPKSIIKFLQHQKNKIDKSELIVEENLKALEEIQQKGVHKPKVYFFEGLQGIIQTYEDTLKEGETIYAIESASHMSPEIQDYLYNTYIDLRIKNKIFAKALMPKTKENEFLHQNDSKHYRETKLIDNALFNFELELNIYGNKTAFIVYNQETYIGIIIENPEIANSLKALFNLIWSSN